jgi:hypothetical protein
MHVWGGQFNDLPPVPELPPGMTLVGSDDAGWGFQHCGTRVDSDTLQTRQKAVDCAWSWWLEGIGKTWAPLLTNLRHRYRLAQLLEGPEPRA